MTTEIQKPPAHTSLEASVLKAKTWAATLTVKDNPQYLTASDGLKRIKAIRDEIAKIHDPAIEAAHKSHKAAITAKKTLTDPLDAAEKSVKAAIGGYLAEQERLRVAEETRLRREAEAAAEKERKRLADEQAKAEADAARLAQESAAAVKTADPLKIAEAEIAQAEAEQAAQESQTQLAAVVAAPVYVAPTVPAVRGQSVSKTWKARVVNLPELVRFIGASGAIIENCERFLTANDAGLNQYARAMQHKAALPGVDFYEESRLTQRKD
jgi:hypothetical protein